MQKSMMLCVAVAALVAASCGPAPGGEQAEALVSFAEMDIQQPPPPPPPQLVPIAATTLRLSPELAKECQLQTVNATLPNPSITSKQSGEYMLFADLDVANGQQTVVHALTNNGRKSVTLSWTDPLNNKEILVANFTDGVRASAIRCDAQIATGSNYQLVNRTVAKIGANDSYSGIEAYIPATAAPGINTSTTFALQTESETGEVQAEWLRLQRMGDDLRITASSREFAAAFNASTLGISKAELERAANRSDTRAEYKVLRDLSETQLVPADGATEFSIVRNIGTPLTLPDVTLDKRNSILLLGPDKKALTAGALTLAPQQ